MTKTENKPKPRYGIMTVSSMVTDLSLLMSTGIVESFDAERSDAGRYKITMDVSAPEVRTSESESMSLVHSIELAIGGIVTNSPHAARNFSQETLARYAQLIRETNSDSSIQYTYDEQGLEFSPPSVESYTINWGGNPVTIKSVNRNTGDRMDRPADSEPTAEEVARESFFMPVANQETDSERLYRILREGYEIRMKEYDDAFAEYARNTRLKHMSQAMNVSFDDRAHRTSTTAVMSAKENLEKFHGSLRALGIDPLEFVEQIGLTPSPSDTVS